MSLTVSSGLRLSDSSEVKFELLGGEDKLFSPAALGISSVFKVEEVAKRLLSNYDEIKPEMSPKLDLPMGDGDMPSEDLLLKGWFGQRISMVDSTPIAESCHSEMPLTESRPSETQSAPAAIPMDKLKESWNSVNWSKRNLHAHSVLTSSLENSWDDFKNTRSGSASAIRANNRQKLNQGKSPIELPETPVSLVTDAFLANKTRILGGASLAISAVGIAGAATTAVVAASVFGMGATALNISASEAGRYYDRMIVESSAEIWELDEELKQTIDQSPAPDTIELLRKEREQLGKGRDSTVEKRKLASVVEIGSSVAGFFTLGASAAAIPDVLLINGADALGTVGNGLTAYGAAADISDIVEGNSSVVQRSIARVKEFFSSLVAE